MILLQAVTTSRLLPFDIATVAWLYGVFLVVIAALWKLLTPFRQKMQVEDAKSNASAWRSALTDGGTALLAAEIAHLKELRERVESDALAIQTLQRLVEAQGVAVLVMPEIHRAMDRNNVVLAAVAEKLAIVEKKADQTRTIVGDVVAVMRAKGDWSGSGHRHSDDHA